EHENDRPQKIGIMQPLARVEAVDCVERPQGTAFMAHEAEGEVSVRPGTQPHFAHTLLMRGKVEVVETDDQALGHRGALEVESFVEVRGDRPVRAGYWRDCQVLELLPGSFRGLGKEGAQE